MDQKQHYLPWVPVAGFVAGLLSGFPLVWCCTCCTGPLLFSLLAALFAVKMVVDKANLTLSAAEGAVIGLIIGVLAGGMGGMIGGVWNFLSGGNHLDPEQLRRLPEATRDLMRHQNPAVTAIGSAMYVFLSDLLGAVVGGLIGVSVFKKDPPMGGYGGGGQGYAPPMGQAPGSFQNPQQPPSSGGGFGPGPNGF